MSVNAFSVISTHWTVLSADESREPLCGATVLHTPPSGSSSAMRTLHSQRYPRQGHRTARDR